MELLILLAGLWLLSPIGLVVALVLSRRQRSAQVPAVKVPDVGHGRDQPGGNLGELPLRDITSLLLLQLELKKQLDAGALAPGEHAALARSLDELWAGQLQQAGFQPDTGKWQGRRDEAWNVFVRRLAEPPGPPPWRTASADASSAPPAARPAARADARQVPVAKARRAHPALAPQPDGPSTSVSPTEAPAQPERPPAEAPERLPAPSASPPAAVPSTPTPGTPPPVIVPAEQAGTSAFAFEPAEPSAVDKVIQTVSGWPKLVAPFLAQNIGWFIGGFCFLAGTLFLVSVTTGFVNALVILASLGVYTGFLLWAGYGIRRKRPDLRTSSNVLLTISMLLAPLNLTAGVHLLSAGIGSMLALGLGIALAAAQCVAVLVAARLSNALIDKALPARHAQLFTALGALQLFAPLIGASGHWLPLAAAHAAILALLGWGLLAFAGEWVRSIFLDRRLIAYYAAGLLVFAAVVSFVQLARAFPAPLPRGYLGPYLMALCAMLFYVDATLKEWSDKYPLLTRFTIGLYGLSVLALLLCFDTPGPRIVALVLAVATYAQVLWRYTSVPALYLLLAALGWLYGSIALEPVARQYHLLASLPGLAGVFALMHWCERRSVALATVCLRAFGLAFITLTAWSLFHGQPGPVAFATGASATIFLFYTLNSAPWLLRIATRGRPSATAVNLAPWYYAVGTLAAVTLAYAPPLPFLSWSNQLAFGLLSLASVAAWSALHLRAGASRVRTEACLNIAIVLVAAAVLLGACGARDAFPLTPILAVLLTFAGALSAWLSIELRAQWLFYGALAALGLTALIVKRTYFSAPSFGTGAMLGLMTLWVLVWWLDGGPKEAQALDPEAPGQVTTGPGPMRVLGCIPIARTGVLANGIANR